MAGVAIANGRHAAGQPKHGREGEHGGRISFFMLCWSCGFVVERSDSRFLRIFFGCQRASFGMARVRTRAENPVCQTPELFGHPRLHLATVRFEHELPALVTVAAINGGLSRRPRRVPPPCSSAWRHPATLAFVWGFRHGDVRSSSWTAVSDRQRIKIARASAKPAQHIVVAWECQPPGGGNRRIEILPNRSSRQAGRGGTGSVPSQANRLGGGQ